MNFYTYIYWVILGTVNTHNLLCRKVFKFLKVLNGSHNETKMLFVIFKFV